MDPKSLLKPVGFRTRHACVRRKAHFVVRIHISTAAEADGCLIGPLPVRNVVDLIAPDGQIARLEGSCVATTGAHPRAARVGNLRIDQGYEKEKNASFSSLFLIQVPSLSWQTIVFP